MIARLSYLAGRAVGMVVQPFIDGVMDGAFGEPDEPEIVQNITITEPVSPDARTAWFRRAA